MPMLKNKIDITDSHQRRPKASALIPQSLPVDDPTPEAVDRQASSMFDASAIVWRSPAAEWCKNNKAVYGG